MQYFIYILCFYLFFKYCFPFLSPFICGFIFAKTISHFKPKNRSISFLLYFILLLFLFFILLFLIFSLYRFMKLIYFQFPNFITQFQNLNTRFIFLKDILTYLESYLITFIPYISSFFILIPNTISFLFLTFFFTFLNLLDIHALTRIIKTLLPNHYPQLLKLQNTFFQTLYSILISTFQLWFLTWIFCFIGFSLLKTNHPLFYSLLLSLFDPIPFLGIGIILIPLSLYLFLIGNSNAFFYFLMYLIITTIRFIIEPKIMSKQLNIPFLLHIFMMFFCEKLFGWIGFLYSPIFCVLLVIWYKEKQMK